MKAIKSETEALEVAVRIIVAQDRLLAAYRSRSLRAPGSSIDSLTTHRPRLEEYLKREKTEL